MTAPTPPPPPQPFGPSSQGALERSGTGAQAPPDRSAVGIGWRQPHEADLLQRRPPLGFIEVHSENFFGDGGAALATLVQARSHYAVSLHGVGLGLGSAAGIDPWHLDRLAALVERIAPVRVSDHACFARAPLRPGQTPVHGSDLLPIAFDEATLARMVRHVQQVQERLKRPILVENLSAYLRSRADSMDEAEFFNRLAQRSGCALLLDVNNLVVNAINAVGDDQAGAAVAAFLAELDPAIVGQMHLAGHARVDGWAIDDHGSRVPPLVWQAYRQALAHCGEASRAGRGQPAMTGPCVVPTLIEWDTDLPSFGVLLGEADEAARLQQAVSAEHAPRPMPGRTAPQGVSGVNAPQAMPAGGAPPDRVHSLGAEASHENAQVALLAALWTPVNAAATPETGGPPSSVHGAPDPAGWQSVRPLQPSATAGSAPQPIAVPALALYRSNARAIARRALAAAFPTVAALVGDEAWASLARRHWLEHPPRRGDLAEWGIELPQALAADAQLADCPYLSDVARLDWAAHRAATAADADAQSLDLAALGRAPPEQLRLWTVPGAGLLRSCWPVVSLRDAHDPASATTLAEAAESLSAQQAQTAWVWRPAGNWRVQAGAVSVGDAACLQALLDGQVLADALDRALAADAHWAFDQWLLRAIQQGWLARIAVADAAVPACGHPAAIADSALRLSSGHLPHQPRARPDHDR